eukprot:gb/GFBE01004206.1/.p1 GENE.gb/GFBE01004206.1/~~gb/GFBE01004206.1/.p1  ORF type:complete len:378 (+),score=63.59 gb/GFBE01004206.1/:1-1134(+)
MPRRALGISATVVATVGALLTALSSSLSRSHGPTFCGLARATATGRDIRLSGRRAWLEVTRAPDMEAKGTGRVLPVFPSPSILWPGGVAQFGVIEPAHQRLYQDLLESGARHVVAPLVYSPVAHCGAGREGFPQRPDKYSLHSVAAVLRLEELQDASESSGGLVKYVAKHLVEGRARIKRALNPSALFETNEDQEKTDYLRVEVELLPEQDPEEEEASSPAEDTAAELAGAWEELRLLSEQLVEPRFESPLVPEKVAAASSWRLSESWYKLRSQVHNHREQARIATAVNAWIKAEKEQGRLHGNPSKALEHMPQPLLDVVLRLNSPTGPKFETSFYDPFLRLLAAGGHPKRKELLLQMALEEVKTVRARMSIRDLLD